ncbi:Gfo/Idh/MocA family protein [Streptomyces sp. NPDC093097]|uniref:Gfo/Idh/MocA family protein n=1 Tax=Streptomyces sp. NPDC093097 TaxID=3366027 RepID=UPI00382EB89D
MADQLRVGIVGIGIIAQTHLEVLAEDERFTVSFTVDPHRDEPVDFRGTRPPHYPALHDALDAHDPHLVVIATPTEAHAALAVQALTGSAGRVLVEKPLVHTRSALARLHALDPTADVRGRLLTAHHFAFSPEVRWAADQLAAHPEWGPITSVTSAFYDPYVLRGQQAFDSYVSSWMDSGVNQLSVLARLVELTGPVTGSQADGGASAWYTAAYTSRGTTGTARLRSSWHTGTSSKETVVTFAESGVEMWIDHTAMTGFAARNSELLSTHGSDGRTPRKIAHYRPLYDSIASGTPDAVLGFPTAVQITELHHVAGAAEVGILDPRDG